jgi:hypothetical protein
MIFKTLVTIFLLVLIMQSVVRAEEHPHIFVNNGDKEAILNKISQQPWAAKIFNEMKQRVTPYVDRHQTNPDWILSRYLMNRVPGKRYTRFFSDTDGTQLIKYEGDAPFPTVRVSPHKRVPLTKNGFKYKMPSIEELVPNDTSTLMLLQSTEPGKGRELVDPQAFVGDINDEINQLVQDAAIVYWLTGEKKYAVFAADVLEQWALGASYQNPIEGAGRCGFLDIQTLGDRSSVPLILAYDFIYDFMKQKKYETKYFENVFTKIANTLTVRGYTNNNWFAAETPALVLAAMSLEDKKQKDYYLSFFLSRDTVINGIGQLSLPSAVKKWFTPDGHWKEPGGYHNFPVSSLLYSALALEKNGYQIFDKYPTLFNASFVMLKYSFPNYKASSFGDTGRPSESPEMLEIGIEMADKYKLPVLSQLTASMDVLIKNKQYKREQSGFLGLLCFLPEIPKSKGADYQWPRSGELDFAGCYLQRNGTDSEKGLMYVVQGASYNHNHANGMSMELYGAGYNMGIDPGNGPTYESPMHVQYYTQFAAHNTVTGAASSTSDPVFKGGGGMKNIGKITLEAMEPKPEKAAVSPFCSFTDTRYKEASTETNQQRTMAIIRTSDSTGYYIDIYRSDNPKSNEYLYHNIGNEVTLSTQDGKPLDLKPAEFPISKVPFDPSGFRKINLYHSAGHQPNGVVALFDLKEDLSHQKFMQVTFPGEANREFYTAMAPSSGTAQAPYSSKPTPTIICRQEGEAWNRPFVAVYEPFQGLNKNTVTQVELMDKSQPGVFSALKIVNRNGNEQMVLQDVIGEKIQNVSDCGFKGYYGVVGLSQKGVDYLYLGEGSYISYKGFSMSAVKGSSANLTIDGTKYMITCNQTTEISLPLSGKMNLFIQVGGEKKSLKTVLKSNGVVVVVPAVKDAVITIE